METAVVNPHRESNHGWSLREHLEWLLTDPDVALIPVEPLTKSPVLPCVAHRDDTDGFVYNEDDRHGPCRRFGRAARSATRDVDSLMRVLDLHPELFVGVVPTNRLLAIDFDAPHALDAFLAATGLRLHEHLVVETRRGVHLYLHADPDPETGRFDLGARTKVDLRHSGNGFLIAPGGPRRDGGRYLIAAGEWSRPQRADGAVLGYFASRKKPGPRPLPAQPRSTQSGSRRRRRATDKIQQLSAAWSCADPRYTAARKLKTESEDLCSIWLHGYHSGLSPSEIVDLVTEIAPAPVERRLATRSIKWLREDAERVYGKVRAGFGRKSFAAHTAQRTVADRFGDSHPVTAVLDFFVDKANRVQSPFLNVGVEELGEAFSVSKNTAGRYVRALLELGVLRVVRRHFFDPDRPERNRTRRFEIAWMIAESSPDRAETVDGDGFSPSQSCSQKSSSHRAAPRASAPLKAGPDATPRRLTRPRAGQRGSPQLRYV